MRPLVVFTGNLGKDAEVINLDGGRKVVVLSVATNESYTDSKGEKQQKTQWHTVKSFQKEVSEKFTDNLKKGTKIEVRGHLMYRPWEKEIGGETVKFTETYIDLVELGWV